MFKVIKLASGRFEIYQEDELGNNVMTFPETFGTPEEANAKLAELNQPIGQAANKPVDSVQKPPQGATPEKTAEEVQAEADAKIKADEEAAAKVKADEEAADASKSADEAAKTGAEGSKPEAKEGDVCETADGTAGTLRKEGDALVCVVDGQ